MSRPAREFKLDKNMLDLYCDYLITSFGTTTATGSGELLGISNDSVSRFLGGIKFDRGGKSFAKNELTSKDLWGVVKSTIRADECEEGCLVIDDTVEEKTSSDENDVVCWHYDHCSSRNIKGINLLNFLYLGQKFCTPIAFEVIKKTEKYLETKIDQIDPKTGKEKVVEKRKSKTTKNEMAQFHIAQICKNQVKFRYVLMDTWFACNETLELINRHHKYYVVPLKSNRKLTTSKESKLKGKWIKLDNLELNQQLENTNHPIEIWLEGLDHSVLLTKQIFTNKDGSIGVMYFITNDKSKLTQDKSEIYNIYQKRWKIEEFHKSIKSNLGFSKSPTKTPTTQINHFFCSIYSYLKLEALTKSTKLKNHFQLKATLYAKAIQSAHQELIRLKLGVPCER